MASIRNALQRIIDEPFIASTGAAAFVHSTWSLAVLFSGNPPTLNGDVGFFFDWLLFWLPAAFIAFAIDVGQIVTSAQIRSGKRNAAKMLTFSVLAVATYYLQWLYIVHHMPALDLGDGIRSDWQAGITAIRDFAVFAIPALLPIATVLYTISHEHAENAGFFKRITSKMQRKSSREKPLKRASKRQDALHGRENATTQRTNPPNNNGAMTGEVLNALHENVDETWTASCPYCDRAFTKPTEAQAKFALTAHLRTHERKPVAMQANGHSAEGGTQS